MASSFVFYKFKSQREPSRIAFDGTSITVFDLKKEIIAENKMGKGADFDFAIYHADTEEGRRAMSTLSTHRRLVRSTPLFPGACCDNLSFPFYIPSCVLSMCRRFHAMHLSCDGQPGVRLFRALSLMTFAGHRNLTSFCAPVVLVFVPPSAEYTKDHELIPRSTSVIARRLPPARPGRGNALKYMAGTDESGQGLQSGRGAAPEPRGGVGSGFSKDMYTKRFDGREDPQPSGSNQVRSCEEEVWRRQRSHPEHSLFSTPLFSLSRGSRRRTPGFALLPVGCASRRCE